MDYEKLIEQLKQKDGLWCSVHTGEKLVTDAATALSTLQAENEKRQDELEQAKAEIIRLKHYEDKCHDCPIVCAKTEIIKAHEELEAVQAELEQVKRENNKLERFLGELEGAVYTRQYHHLRPMIEEWHCPDKED